MKKLVVLLALAFGVGLFSSNTAQAHKKKHHKTSKHHTMRHHKGGAMKSTTSMNPHETVKHHTGGAAKVTH